MSHFYKVLWKFLSRLGAKLKKMDAKIVKINFNGGDFFFYPKGRIYRGSKENLAAFYEDFFHAKSN